MQRRRGAPESGSGWCHGGSVSADGRGGCLPAEVPAFVPVGAERGGVDSQHVQSMLSQQTDHFLLGDTVHLHRCGVPEELALHDAKHGQRKAPVGEAAERAARSGRQLDDQRAARPQNACEFGQVYPAELGRHVLKHDAAVGQVERGVIEQRQVRLWVEDKLALSGYWIVMLSDRQHFGSYVDPGHMLEAGRERAG